MTQGSYFAVQFCWRILKCLCFKFCVRDTNGILFPMVFSPLCSERFKFASHSLNHYSVHFHFMVVSFKYPWLHTKLCANIMICLCDFSIVQNRHITNQVGHYSVYFHVIVVSFPKSAAPYKTALIPWFLWLDFYGVQKRLSIKANLAVVICNLVVCIWVCEL